MPNAMPSNPPALTGHTRLFGIVADPITHVRAPQIFNAAFAKRGIDAVMLPLHVLPKDVPSSFIGFKALANLDGLVITVPHKFAFAALMDELGPHARRTQAVNAIRRNSEGRWVGELFDGVGFVEGLMAHTIDPKGKSFLIYGAGGAGTAIVSALLAVAPTRITVVDSIAGRAEALCQALGSAALPVETISNPDPAEFDIVVNATPMGLEEDDPLPFDPARMKPDGIVAEVVMMPSMTRLLKVAEQRGLRIHQGIHMLEGQFNLMLEFFGLLR